MLTLRRKRSGYFIAETGPALWIIFMVFSFPLFVLGTEGMRYALLLNAAHAAATAGAEAKSFLTNTSSTDLSATNMASQVVTTALTGVSGITGVTTTSYIVVCPLGGSVSSRQTTALSSPANTSTNAYNLEVDVAAQLSPLVTCPKNKFFGSIPGLTGPLSMTVKADSFFENAQGLNQ